MKVFLAIACLIAAVSADVNSADFKEFAAGNAQFGFDMYKEALKSNSGNLLVCPISVDVVMALANAGAEGETSEQIVKALHLPATKDKIKGAMEELLPLLKGNDNYKLNSANKMYVKDGYKIKDAFKTLATTVFDAEVENIDMADATKAVNDMNQWVEDKTENKIKDLLNSQDISRDTRMVLINALYVSANWEHEFKEGRTSKKSFHMNAQNQVEVDMMETTNVFPHYQCDIHHLQVLEIPYQGDELVMTILLPNEKEGLANIESKLDEVMSMPLSMEAIPVKVNLPKFKIESTLDMTNILKQLGVVNAFDEDLAKLPEIADEDEDLYINKVAQKTFIKVDERGTEAAASTSVVINAVKSSLEFFGDVEIFNADHPFMFVITHKPSGVNLFIGKVTKPELN